MAENFMELDFFEVKKNLKEYLSTQDRFKDYDFEGSNINVLLDVLAYNTVYNNIYSNMAFSEMFLDTAQVRDSVVSKAKELNYIPRSRTSSYAVVQVEVLNVVGLPPFIVLPKYTKFTGKVGNVSYSFTTNETYAIDAASGSYCSGNIPIYEGLVATEAFVVTDNPQQKIVLSNKDVDTTSISVTVRQNSDPQSNTEEFIAKENLFGILAEDPVFYLQEGAKEQYEITFGQNVFGKQPVPGNVILVSYRLSSGESPNGIKSFTMNNLVEGYNTKVTTMSTSFGGSEREDVDSIKYFAPRSIQVQDRAVITEDYKILLKNKFPEITAISVYGGEEASPPQYGRTIISVAINNMDSFSDAIRDRITDYLKERTTVAIEPVVKSPEYMYISVESTVVYDTKKTGASSGTIKNIVKKAITDYWSKNLNDFGKTLRTSRLMAVIDASDKSVSSNDTDVRIVIPVVPSLETQNKYEIYFENEIEAGRPISIGDSLSNYNTAVRSSIFTVDGQTGYIIDDGKGILNLIKNVNDSFTFIKKSIGTVDYITGKIVLNKMNITEFNGNGIEISVRPQNTDIRTPKSRIISIRDSDILLKVNGEHLD
jgi:hypothetical protein